MHDALLCTFAPFRMYPLLRLGFHGIGSDEDKEARVLKMNETSLNHRHGVQCELALRFCLLASELYQNLFDEEMVMDGMFLGAKNIIIYISA